MRTIIHDLDSLDFLKLESTDIVINNVNNNSCIGCFNCWTKTPLKCSIKDKICLNGEKLLKSDELIIISKCIDGCYSSTVKRALERTISYVQPYFTIREKEIHHETRTDKKIIFKIFFYGDNINDISKETAKNLALANKKNLNAEDPIITFTSDIKEIKI